MAYFAGGCVRDGLLNRDPSDFDVATNASPDQVAQWFHPVQRVGASFGVVLVRSGGHTIEVATFRSDGPYSDSRRPDSVRFADARADAERRDFTFNALFLDPLAAQPVPAEAVTTPTVHGTLIDFVDGKADLDRGLLKAVGDPDARLREDHLRALRAVRFAARLGFRVDLDTAAAIQRHASDLSGVSRERIGDEVRIMLSHPTRTGAFRLLLAWKLAGYVFGVEPNSGSEPGLLAALPERSSFELALAAVVVDLGAPATTGVSGDPDALLRVRDALMLSNDEYSKLAGLIRFRVPLRDHWVSMGVAARKRAAARELFSDHLSLLAAERSEAAELVRADVDGLASDGVGIDPPRLLTGDHLIAGGWRPGPTFKSVLETVFDAQLEGRIRTFEEARELAARLRV